MFDFLQNLFLNRYRYKSHADAVIVSCFYNPLNSPYRLLGFQKWYHSIKHLNHRIIECLIGEGAKPQLPMNQFIARVHTNSLLWHKESLLNKVIAELPKEYKYVFWFDADVLLTNNNWLVDAVAQLQTASLVQPFEYCVHLKRNQVKPDFNVDAHRATVNDPARRHPQMWRSFCATHVQLDLSGDLNYDRHGHVGFAWGARRAVLERVRLYDKALIGGSDHILAHAAAGQIPHPCITNSFTDNLDEVLQWSKEFYQAVGAAPDRIGYVRGDLYHIWHGEITNRQYLRRIRDFTPQTRKIWKKDRNGLWKSNSPYMRGYYRQREATQIYDDGFDDFAAGFEADMGYDICDINDLFGRPEYEKQYDEDPQKPDQTGSGQPDADAGADVVHGGDYQSSSAASRARDQDRDALDSARNMTDAGGSAEERQAAKDSLDQASEGNTDAGEAQPAEASVSENFS